MQYFSYKLMYMLNKTSIFYRKTGSVFLIVLLASNSTRAQQGTVTHLIDWKGHKATFQGNGHILHLGLVSVYVDICNCQNLMNGALKIYPFYRL